MMEELRYSKDHEWVMVKGNLACVGITDYAQRALGDIVYVDIPETDVRFDKGSAFGVVESVKATSDLYLPVSGRIVQVNGAVIDDPSLLNRDAFENWIVQVEMEAPEELEQLMNAQAYAGLCQE